ncbi:MAG: rod shape-determining protein MreC [Candidatus Competibacteraceae bacterium]|nr:rod shape-determining protein MreC [Candidatus Competibacteraceae bacterium]
MSRLQSRDARLFAPETATNLRVVLFVLASVVLMTLDHRHHHLELVRDVLSAAVYPAQYLVQAPFEAGGWLSENLKSLNTLKQENQQLRRRQLQLNVQLQRLSALEAENRRLRALLDSSTTLGQRVQIAELLTVDLDPYDRHQILINRGSHHGVQQGQPLLDQAGIVGQIVHAGPLTANGVLITDPNHALPVQVVRNGLRSLAVGTGRSQELSLPYIPNNEDIRPGDLLVTSGLGGRFPPGYPVARVSQVAFDPSRPFARITARPTAHLDRIREVLLMMEPARQAPDPPREAGTIAAADPEE